jgi:hypothetical protein
LPELLQAVSSPLSAKENICHHRDDDVIENSDP